MNIDDMLQNASYSTHKENCKGCENRCSVQCFQFQNGRTFYSGNQCEKIYNNASTNEGSTGVNMFIEKNDLLWRRPTIEGKIKIGIPRALGMYEDYPFWHSLFTQCGLQIVLSQPSTNRLYEKGIRSIMADNICFPAKLMHGHIFDLIKRKVDRIFYPWVVFERKEDDRSNNSFNCPIVSGYSDVLQSSIAPLTKFEIPLDAPIISFQNEQLLTQSCVDYLRQFGIPKSLIVNAVCKALQEQKDYLTALERRGIEILKRAEKERRAVILLAGRPYHIDPLIEHKLSYAIAEMGIDVITENVAINLGKGVYDELNALSQWAYPNRIFKAAYFAAKCSANLHFVELTSFGCGPDAFILDEVKLILNRYNKNLTILKIDDVNNIGSLKLRIRSLIEGARMALPLPLDKPQSSSLTTRPFVAGDKENTIIVPFFAEGYNDFIVALCKNTPYNVVALPMVDKDDVEVGLQNINNDVCYPAIISVGSVIKTLKEHRNNLENIAIGITQTGGQCRASNYYALLKNAMVQNGFANVPVVSFGLGAGLQNEQPGFAIPWKKIWKIALYTMFYADTILKLFYAAVAREREQGAAKKILDEYTQLALPYIQQNRPSPLLKLMKAAVHEFCIITDMDKKVESIGVVGEIYVKYNSFANLNVVEWLIKHGVEVIPPAISTFFLTKLPNTFFNKHFHIQDSPISPTIARLINKYIMHVAHKFDTVCQPFKPYRPFIDVYQAARLATQVINPAADFGEGWSLPGEICHLAQTGVRKIISVQPFGCIANHIISKGIEKRILETYPNLSLLFLDFDNGTSEANIQNRLYFMLYDTK